MCGIAGLVALDSRVKIDKELLETMTDSLSHRGPDGRGVWFDVDAGLGHRRLAIIDPQSGQQPLISENGKAVLVYNGELYNYKILKHELESAGIRFFSNCDTEVVLKSLLHWGIEKSLDKFRGMYAFALWEKDARRLSLARDPMGIKPLYWAMRGGLLRFGSEIKAILCDPAFPRSVDSTVLTNYLAHYRLNFNNRTFFRHINEVEAGSWIQWEGKRRKEKTYWKLDRIPESEKNDISEENAAEEFRLRMKESVKKRLMSDVPVGAYLSGGIDSSVIVRLMKELGHENIQTFSIGFEEQGYNEFQYSTLVSQSLKVPNKQIALKESGYFNELEKLIKIKDAPLSVPNEVPLFFLSRVLKKSIKVVLSGEGADELLGGYSFLVRSPHDYILAQSLKNNRNLFAPEEVNHLESALVSLYGKSRFKDQLEQFLPVYSWMPAKQRNTIFNQDMLNSRCEGEISSFWIKTWEEMDKSGLDPYEKVLHVLQEIHLSALLKRLDATTMAEGVEGRLPFTDRDLIEWVNKLPIKYKIRWINEAAEKQASKCSALEVAGKLDLTKYILRLSFAGQIPDEILVRKKYAFPVPLDRWFFGTWHNWAKERILDPVMSNFFNLKSLEDFITKSRGKDEGMKLWMLANLSIWLNTYFR